MKQETEENIDYENNEHCKVVAGDTPFDTFKNYYSTLRKGNRSDFTTELQHMLNKVGYGINIDGIFGNDTKNAVKSFQKSKGLKQDGIVGKMTWNTFVKTISEDSETKNQ
ncbi:peptidoglycan-binding protein [archaeon]|nr:peptidoglycan-binding protein [archaeon]